MSQWFLSGCLFVFSDSCLHYVWKYAIWWIWWSSEIKYLKDITTDITSKAWYTYVRLSRLKTLIHTALLNSQFEAKNKQNKTPFTPTRKICRKFQLYSLNLDKSVLQPQKWQLKKNSVPWPYFPKQNETKQKTRPPPFQRSVQNIPTIM